MSLLGTSFLTLPKPTWKSLSSGANGMSCILGLSPEFLLVDSSHSFQPSFYPKTGSVSLGSGSLLERRIPGKNGEGSTRVTRDLRMLLRKCSRHSFSVCRRREGQRLLWSESLSRLDDGFPND